MFENLRAGAPVEHVLCNIADEFLGMITSEYGSCTYFMLEVTERHRSLLAVRCAGHFGESNCMQRWTAIFSYGIRRPSIYV